MGMEDNEVTGSGPSKPTTPTSDSEGGNIAESQADTIDPDKSSFNGGLDSPSQGDAATLDSVEMIEDDMDAAEKEPLAGPSGINNKKHHSRPVISPATSPDSNAASIDDLITESKIDDDDSDRLNTCTEDFESQVSDGGTGKSKKTWDVRCVVIGVLVLLIMIAGAVAAIIAHRYKGPPMIYDFKFASFFKDGMVLQRAPRSSVIWGYGPIISENTTVKVTLSGGGRESVFHTHVKSTFRGQIWKVVMDPVSEPFGETRLYNVSAALEVENGMTISVKDIVFGDVWVCAGQFDTQFNLNDLNNTSELEGLSNLRLFGLTAYTSNIPRYDIRHLNVPWIAADQVNQGFRVRFPKLCYDFGRELHQKLGYPIGLVSMANSDSVIEDWTPHKALKECGIPLKGSMSQVWNGMVSPLLNMAFYGAVWYQGDRDAMELKSLFNCTFLGFLEQWRNHSFKFTHGATDRHFPVGVIQLPPNRSTEHTAYESFTDIRWGQTANYGTVPNQLMKRVYLAATMDLPEAQQEGGEGSAANPVVLSRLIKGTEAVAYRQKNITYLGPFPTDYELRPEDATLVLHLNNSGPIQRVSNDGFEICCSASTETLCLASFDKASYAPGREWRPAPVTAVTATTVTVSWRECHDKGHHALGVRYAWRDTPCRWLDCAIYGQRSQLPMLPYIRQGMVADSAKHALPLEQINVF